MSEYIEVISKLKPKNYEVSNFKILDVTDIQVNIPTNYNVLCTNTLHTFTASGINWDLNNNSCMINGDLHIGGSLYQLSDRNLKQSIFKIDNPLYILNNINGVSFNWKQNGKHDYGLIAQQLQQFIPQMVYTNKDTNNKQVSYIKLIPFLLQGIKQLNNRIQILQKKQYNSLYERTKRYILKVFKFKNLFKLENTM